MDNLEVTLNDQQQQKPKKTFSVRKIVFVILGLIVVAEIIYAVKMLTFSPSPLPPQAAVKPAALLTGGKMSLSTAKSVVNVNEVVPVLVTIDSGGHTLNGIDLIVHFDPKVLEATPAGLVKGTFFNEYPLLAVDKNKGLISISGITDLNTGFKGSGQFAVLNLKAKAPGKTSLLIEFKEGATTASNLVEMSTSKNILEEVGNLELTVQ